MKIVLLITLFFIMGLQTSFAQVSDETYYKERIEHYNRIKNIGIILAATGTALEITSLILVSQNELGTGVAGGILMVAGLPPLITGVAMLISGSTKKHKFQRKLDKLNVGYFQQDGAQGLTLTLRL